MKLTDYCILFGMLLMGLFFVDDMKINVIKEIQMSQIMLNNNMDEIVVDGLYAGFIGVDADGIKKVNLDVAATHIFDEMSVLFYGKSGMRSMVEKYVKVLIYVDESGYFLYDKGTWQDKVFFEETASHSERIESISGLIEDELGNIPLIAYNAGESYKNTIDDNTLIIVYCGYNFITNEFVYKNTYMSAACIKENND